MNARHYRPEARTVTISGSGDAHGDIALTADTRPAGVVVTMDGTRPLHRSA